MAVSPLGFRRSTSARRADATVFRVLGLRAKPGARNALTMVLESLTEPSRNEVGCLQYVVLQSEEDADEFVVIEKWREPIALRMHDTSPHWERASSEWPALVERPVTGGLYRQIK